MHPTHLMTDEAQILAAWFATTGWIAFLAVLLLGAVLGAGAMRLTVWRSRFEIPARRVPKSAKAE